MSHILMVAAENDALPQGKVGGIGDVIRDVPKYLAEAGQMVSVVIPSYGYQAKFQYAQHLTNVDVMFAGKKETVELFQLHLNDGTGVTQYVLEHPLFSNAGAGNIYKDDGANQPFASDASKFALFSTAVCQLLVGYWSQHFNVLHLHDWHSAFIAIHRALNPEYCSLKAIRCVYTIHNLALQGTRPISGDVSAFETWFPHLSLDYAKVVDPQYHDCINPARGGINYSDSVHVVSPSYANEVIKASNIEIGFIGGEGLEQDLQNAQKEGRLFGILNGCQYDLTLPDKCSYTEYLHDIQRVLFIWMAKNITIKSPHLLAYERLKQWENTPFTGPMLTSVGRLTTQKVALLLAEQNQVLVLESLLQLLNSYDGCFILLGSGDSQLEQKMTEIMAKYDNFLFLNGYDNQLSLQTYAQGDLFVMPSSFEPCGISQMLSMRAGQPCLVHNIGGLKDTVEHLVSGFCFQGHDIDSQINSLKQEVAYALTLYANDAVKWRKIKDKAEQQRFTWQEVIKQYIAFLY